MLSPKKSRFCIDWSKIYLRKPRFFVLFLEARLYCYYNVPCCITFLAAIVLISKMAHKLCDRCQHLSFSLHEADLCESFECDNEGPSLGIASLHSVLVPHYPTLDALGASSRAGCHLCSLIHAGLQSASRVPTRLRSAPKKGIYLWFECSTSAIPINKVTEDLFATVDNIVTSFAVGTLPKTCCTDPDYFDEQSPYIKGNERPIKFRTICMRNSDQQDLTPSEVSYVGSKCKSTLTSA